LRPAATSGTSSGFSSSTSARLPSLLYDWRHNY
jgi:hypothetical protein